jgi:hypothetical protein
MNNNQLSKMVENLKTKIKKLENQTKTDNKITEVCEIQTFRIQMPLNTSSKKYIGLLFNNNYDSSTEMTDTKNCISFIKLGKNKNIINYSITLKVNSKDCKDNICTFSLGIRDGNNKIKIIKGSKVQCIVDTDTIDNCIIINNTTLYESTYKQELCLIADISKRCSIINKKSIIKILNL